MSKCFPLQRAASGPYNRAYHEREMAAIYELANPLAQDADFCLSLAGQQSCTLACAFAERGHRATGVDPAAAMLAGANRKPSAEQVE